MKILYIWDADYPWDVRAEKICLSLVRKEHEVHLAARNLRKLPQYEFLNGINIHRLRPYANDKVNYTLSFPAFFSPVWKMFLQGLVKRYNIDLLIVRDLPILLAGIWVGKRYGIPVIFDMAEDYVAMLRDIWKARKFKGLNLIMRNPYLARYVEKYALGRVDQILVVIDEAREVIVKRGCDPSKVTIVSNTPSLVTFSKNGNPSDETLQHIRQHFSAIYVGGVQMGRGIQVLLGAIPKLLEKIPDFLFVIVGEGYASKQLKTMISQRKLDDHVLWVGWVDHSKIFDYIRACKIGLIPHFTTDHTSSTIPNKIFDYMGLGIPVIASDAVPLKRVLEEEDCGLTFRSGDSQDLARAILELSTSKHDYRSGGISAVERKYNWKEDEARLLGVANRLFKHNNKRI